MNLLRDTSGAAAAEYALIVAMIGGSLFLASQALGSSIKQAGSIHNFGPDGTIAHLHRQLP